MQKIHKRLKKNIPLYKQIKAHKFEYISCWKAFDYKLPEPEPEDILKFSDENEIKRYGYDMGWKILWDDVPEISEGDLVIYDDGSSEIFQEDGGLGQFYVFFYSKLMQLMWSIDLEWDENMRWQDKKRGLKGEYILLINKIDPKDEYSGYFSWIEVRSLDKHLLIDIADKCVKYIQSDNMDGLNNIRDKYHSRRSAIVDEIEYWKDPKKWWEHPTIDRRIESVLFHIDPEYYEYHFDQKELYIKDIEETLQSVKDFYLPDIMQKDQELGNHIANTLDKVEKSMEQWKKDGCDSDGLLSENQYLYVMDAFKPLDEMLKIRYDMERKIMQDKK